MRNLGWTAVMLWAAATSAPAALIDNFSDGNLTEYTSTTILDANGGASNVAAWQITSGALELNTSTYDGIQQHALIYNGLSLGVGEEIQVDVTHNGASQDLGLYVGGTTPVAGVRQDYVAIYARGNGQIFSRGFNGTTEFPLAGGGTAPYDSLFIARTAVNTYEAGFYDGATRTIVTTRTPSFANDADVVGLYADVRGAGVLGSLDNLRIVPEPCGIALGALGLGVSLAGGRRRQRS